MEALSGLEQRDLEDERTRTPRTDAGQRWTGENDRKTGLVRDFKANAVELAQPITERERSPSAWRPARELCSQSRWVRPHSGAIDDDGRRQPVSVLRFDLKIFIREIYTHEKPRPTGLASSKTTLRARLVFEPASWAGIIFEQLEEEPTNLLDQTAWSEAVTVSSSSTLSCRPHSLHLAAESPL